MNADVFFYALGAIIAAGGISLLARWVRAYFKFRGKRLVTCPENHRAAAVELEARKAAREAIVGKPRFRLEECSRWPDRRFCAQQCLGEIESNLEGCLVRNVVAAWYADKRCAYCGRPITEVSDVWVGREPALVKPSQPAVEWDEVPPEKLPEMFASYAPVCWSCHGAETFRHKFPELVTDRPPSRLRIRF